MTVVFVFCGSSWAVSGAGNSDHVRRLVSKVFQGGYVG